MVGREREFGGGGFVNSKECTKNVTEKISVIAHSRNDLSILIARSRKQDLQSVLNK